MAGIIASAQKQDATPAAPAAASSASGPATNISDPLLRQTKTGVEAKIGPQIKAQFLRIENAGLAILSHGNMTQLVLQKIKSNPDVSGTVSDGVANIIAAIYNEVSAKIPKPQLQAFNAGFVASAPAASVAIMCQVLNMAEQALKTPITQQLVAQCAQATAQKALGKLHINQQQIQQAVTAGQQAQAKKGA